MTLCLDISQPCHPRREARRRRLERLQLSSTIRKANARLRALPPVNLRTKSQLLLGEALDVQMQMALYQLTTEKERYVPCACGSWSTALLRKEHMYAICQCAVNVSCQLVCELLEEAYAACTLACSGGESGLGQ